MSQHHRRLVLGIAIALWPQKMVVAGCRHELAANVRERVLTNSGGVWGRQICRINGSFKGSHALSRLCRSLFRSRAHEISSSIREPADVTVEE